MSAVVIGVAGGVGGGKGVGEAVGVNVGLGWGVGRVGVGPDDVGVAVGRGLGCGVAVAVAEAVVFGEGVSGTAVGVGRGPGTQPAITSAAAHAAMLGGNTLRAALWARVTWRSPSSSALIVTPHIIARLTKPRSADLFSIAVRRARPDIGMMLAVAAGVVIAATVLGGVVTYLRSLELVALGSAVDGLGTARKNVQVTHRRTSFTRAAFEERDAKISAARKRFNEILPTVNENSLISNVIRTNRGRHRISPARPSSISMPRLDVSFT